MPRSIHGGRHELGQNFLHHRPTIKAIVDLVARTDGPILEIGAGDGAITRPLADLGRPLTAIDLDEHRVRRLARALPNARIEHGDAISYPLDSDTVVGNVPFHITTPILRRLLASKRWRHAILLTQWEVARKRAGIGGTTMMTAQSAPWYEFHLEGRVPAWAFTPRASVDGGLLRIARRHQPLVPVAERRPYEAFVRAIFTGRGGTMSRIVQRATRKSEVSARHAVAASGIEARALPRDLDARQWARLWRAVAE